MCGSNVGEHPFGLIDGHLLLIVNATVAVRVADGVEVSRAPAADDHRAVGDGRNAPVVGAADHVPARIAPELHDALHKSILVARGSQVGPGLLLPTPQQLPRLRVVCGDAVALDRHPDEAAEAGPAELQLLERQPREHRQELRPQAVVREGRVRAHGRDERQPAPELGHGGVLPAPEVAAEAPGPEHLAILRAVSHHDPGTLRLRARGRRAQQRHGARVVGLHVEDAVRAVGAAAGGAEAARLRHLALPDEAAVGKPASLRDSAAGGEEDGAVPWSGGHEVPHHSAALDEVVPQVVAVGRIRGPDLVVSVHVTLHYLMVLHGTQKDPFGHVDGRAVLIDRATLGAISLVELPAGLHVEGVDE
mmetsp:Transcript_79890/g.235001  ORF Transcript_79890/g.235001 Transcript_79890/m.235001 type:complete len:362 (-) Transcript_79890:455-1540(-)